MKRYLRVIVCVMLIAGMIVGLGGCKKEPAYERFCLYEVSDAGEKFTTADLQKELDAAGENLKLEDAFYILLYDDGTALVHSLGMEEKMQYNETEMWSVGEQNIQVTYTRAGDMLTIFQDSAVMIYIKK